MPLHRPFRARLLLLSMLCVWPRAATAADTALSLDAAIAAALEHNRQLQMLALQVTQAEQAVALAGLRRLPVFSVSAMLSEPITNVTFQFPAGAFGSFPATGPIPAADAALAAPRQPFFFAYMTAAQPLTQWRRIRAGMDARRVELSVQRERERGAAQELVANVRRRYYALLETDSAFGAAAVAVDAAREVERMLGERVAARIALRADAAEAGVRLARAERARLMLAQALESQKEQLNQLLGRDVRTAFMLVPVPEPVDRAEALDLAIARATGSRADVREARLRLEQAEIDLRAKQSERIPDVSLTAMYVSLQKIDLLPRNLASAGVQVTWEPWDWGRKKREAAQKVDVIAQARLALKDAEERVVLEVREAGRRLESARADLRLAVAVQDAARERLRVRSAQRQEVVVPAGDVLQAQSQLADATSGHQQALSAYWSARAEFERAIGEDVKP